MTHWHPKQASTGSAFAVTPLSRAIEDVLVCQPPGSVVAILDSLLHKRLIQRNRLDALVGAGPHATRHLAPLLDAASGSGIESIVRFGLWADGIEARIQVVVRSRYRVDVIIDDWLVLEIDGRATHAQARAFTADRVREATIMREGRIVLRFAYATVVYDWPFVVACVRDVMTQHAPIH